MQTTLVPPGNISYCRSYRSYRSCRSGIYLSICSEIYQLWGSMVCQTCERLQIARTRAPRKSRKAENQTEGENKTIQSPFKSQSRWGDKPLKLQVSSPQNGTAVLKASTILRSQRGGTRRAQNDDYSQYVQQACREMGLFKFVKGSYTTVPGGLIY